MRRPGLTLVLGLLAACGTSDDVGGEAGDSDVAAEALPPFAPAPATLHRLTDRQLRHTWADLVGVTWTGALPADYVLHGYATVGGAEQTLPPADLELLDGAAWAVAEDAVPDAATAAALLGCEVGGDTDAAVDEPCLRTWLAAFLRRAWRRPATRPEVDALVALHDAVRGIETPTVAVQAVVASVLESPHLVFRVEIGRADPDHPGRRVLTGLELASRLAYFLTDAPPDDDLLAAAEAGELDTPDGLRAAAERLLDTPRADDAFVAFWAETLEVERIDETDKDLTLFPQVDDALRTAMADELRWLFRDVMLEHDGTFAELLTTDVAYVDAGLAKVYGLPPVEGRHVRVTLDPAQARGGLLGRAGVLAAFSHATRTSPTRRGKFVQNRLLCHTIPPPPPGVVASLDAVPDDGQHTLRERLEQHATVPVCASCHRQMDPIGFGLEHFDPIGRYQWNDPSLKSVDATGTLDDVPFDGAAELGRVVAEHPDFPGCMALQLYRHALGRAEQDPELAAVDDLARALVDGGGRLRPLVLALVGHEAFRTASAPTDVCAEDEEGTSRACATSCGEGVETCAAGLWTGCDAPPAPQESCDGVDEDCDGTADEVVTPCEADGLPGFEVCVDGEPGACAVAPEEVP
jgi:hypothetical protein